MIAPLIAGAGGDTSATQSEKPTKRFHLNVMINFLRDLISNLIILAVMLAACCIINLARPGAKANGYLVFVAFIAIALVFDAALSFLVFADSQARYGQFCTTQACMPRFAAYLTACAIAIGLARERSCKTAARTGASAVIRASPYTKSQLPL
jgi:hypothetical protein